MVNPTGQIKEKLYDVIKQARTNIDCANDMRAKVLLKTTADLITGLTSAYEDYESKSRRSQPSAQSLE
jgi:hypothetical protein